MFLKGRHTQDVGVSVKGRNADDLTRRLILMYTEQHLTLREIGKIVGRSGTAVMHRLRAVGITAKDGEWVKTSCAFCGVQVDRTRRRWRKTVESFCTPEHYYASRENPGFNPWRQGQRLARAVVAQHFALESQHVVHHKDGDQTHNDLANLQVYASHSDHMKDHHGKTPTQPLWDGATV